MKGINDNINTNRIRGISNLRLYFELRKIVQNPMNGKRMKYENPYKLFLKFNLNINNSKKLIMDVKLRIL